MTVAQRAHIRLALGFGQMAGATVLQHVRLRRHRVRDLWRRRNVDHEDGTLVRVLRVEGTAKQPSGNAVPAVFHPVTR